MQCEDCQKIKCEDCGKEIIQNTNYGCPCNCHKGIPTPGSPVCCGCIWDKLPKIT